MIRWLSLRLFSVGQRIEGTTILCVKKQRQIAMIGDGQISVGGTKLKNNAVKIHKIQPNILCGYAGGTADCLTFLELLTHEYEKYPMETLRVCVKLAQKWRTNKAYRYLLCEMIVADPNIIILLNGRGDAIEIDDDVLAIGAGQAYAQAASKALLDIEGMTAKDIANKAMNIAADLCVYTNRNFRLEVIDF